MKIIKNETSFNNPMYMRDIQQEVDANYQDLNLDQSSNYVDANVRYSDLTENENELDAPEIDSSVSNTFSENNSDYIEIQDSEDEVY